MPNQFAYIICGTKNFLVACYESLYPIIEPLHDELEPRA